MDVLEILKDKVMNKENVKTIDITIEEIETALKNRGFIKEHNSEYTIYWTLSTEYDSDIQDYHWVTPIIAIIGEYDDSYYVDSYAKLLYNCSVKYVYDKQGNNISLEIAYLLAILNECYKVKKFLFKKETKITLYNMLNSYFYGVKELIEDLKSWL
jgi:hypothetical protein